MKKVSIVGGGPAGLLLAHYLLRRGQYKIDIYERRNDPRLVPFSKHRTYPMALFERGLSALRNIELEESVKANAIELASSIIYQKNGKKKLLPREKPLILIDRNTLVITLLEKLTEKYDNRQVNIHFDCKCDEVDLAAKTAKFSRETQDQFSVNYDLLIGADGVHSAVRSHFLKGKRFDYEQKHLPDVYKMLFIPRTNEKLGIELEADKTHFWRLEDTTRIIGIPQQENTLSCNVIFNAKKNQVLGLSSKEELLQFFEKNFPQISKLIPSEEAEAFLKRPVSDVLTVRCNRYHEGDSALIIGDAAHAISPSMGQGCNSALEDVVILDKLLDEYSENWAEVLPQFTLRRLPDAHAVQEISSYSMPLSKRLFTEFMVRRQIDRIINKIFPQYRSPFLFNLSDTTIPYSEMLKSMRNWISRVKKSNEKFLETL